MLQPPEAAQLDLLATLGPDRILDEYASLTQQPALQPSLPHLVMPAHHDVRASDVFTRRLHGTLAAAAERGPVDFPELLLTPGVGARTVQSLAMVAEVVHGAPYRFQDPARFSLAHGGKDRHPYPVPIKVYDETIRVLKGGGPGSQARARRADAGPEAAGRPGATAGTRRPRVHPWTPSWPASATDRPRSMAARFRLGRGHGGQGQGALGLRWPFKTQGAPSPTLVEPG